MVQSVDHKKLIPLTNVTRCLHSVLQRSYHFFASQTPIDFYVTEKFTIYFTCELKI